MSKRVQNERVKKIFTGDIATGWDTKGKLIDEIRGQDNIVYRAINEYGRDGMRVLDVGCATGRLLSYTDQKFSRCSLYGIDISNDMRNLAENISLVNDNKKTVFEGDFLKYNFGNQLFDMIVLKFVLHHMEDEQFALEKARKLLAPNGVLMLYTPGKAHFKEVFPLEDAERDILGRKDIDGIKELFSKCSMSNVYCEVCKFKVKMSTFENLIRFLKRIGSYQKIMNYTNDPWDETFTQEVKKRYNKVTHLTGEYILVIYKQNI